MSGSSPKQLEANRCNAQHSTKSGDACGPRTPASCPAAISARGSLINKLKPFSVLDEMLVEKTAVAYCRRLCVRPSPSDTFRVVHYQNAIERQLNRAITQLYRLQEHRCLSYPQAMETLPIDKN